MASQPIVLTFLRYYLPGHKSGGPVRSIANIVEALGDEFEFRIVTSDRDILDKCSYPGIETDTWARVGKGWVYYVSKKSTRMQTLVRLIKTTHHDLVYCNSLFDPLYTLLPLISARYWRVSTKPFVIATRGELSPGALSLKQWKKKLFLIVAKVAGLYRRVQWHASTEDEKRLISQKFGVSSSVVVARDLPAPVSEQGFLLAKATAIEPLRIIFLSRISRMKNLGFALCVLTKSCIQIEFDIWGTIEDLSYWKECEKLIDTLPVNISAQYCGIAAHEDVPKILAGYDLLFLPTLGENYGHVIAEAMSVGTPVLISDQTPWHDLAASGVGWDLSLDDNLNSFLEAIESVKDEMANGRKTLRKRVYDFALTRLSDPELLEANRQVFLQAIKKRTSSNKNNKTLL